MLDPLSIKLRSLSLPWLLHLQGRQLQSLVACQAQPNNVPSSRAHWLVQGVECSPFGAMGKKGGGEGTLARVWATSASARASQVALW